MIGHVPGGICLTATGPYEETIELKGMTGAKRIEVIGASRTERRDVPGGCEGPNDPGDGGRFIVITRVGTGDLPPFGECRVVPEGDAYPAIYRQAFGPASKAECERWVEENCGGGGLTA